MSRSLATLVASTFFGWTSNAAKDMAVASFSVDNTGVEGYVKVTNGQLELNLDFTGVTDAALDDDCLTNMAYHIHERYDHANLTDRLGSMCGPTQTGGHWDPWLGCGGATGNDFCTDEDGCVTGSSVLGGTTYDCSTTTFADNPYVCEVGDWSGKYGKFTPDATTNLVQATYYSPYEVSALDLEGLSVVFHCGDDSSRAFCAGFEVTEGEDGDRVGQTGNYDMVAYLDAVSSDSMVLLETSGDYTITVDPTGLTLPTDCGSNLLLRVYEDWLLDTTSSLECGNYTGDFYDPTVTCAYGSNSQFCDMGELCDDSTYTYTCDTTVFGTATTRFNCAPGDLTGKYGMLSATASTTLTGNDPLQIDLSQLSGGSVVLQCADTYEVVACGGFDPVMMTTEDTMMMDMSTTPQDKAFTMSVQFGTIMVMIVSVALMFL